MNRRYCTLPEIFGFRDWFEESFSDLCIEHDRLYQSRIGSIWKADYIFVKGMWCRGYKLLAIATYIFLLLFGWLYWYDVIK